MLTEKTYEFERWSGNKTEVKATCIEFLTGGGIAFFNDDMLILAVQRGDWNNVHEVTSKVD